MMTSNGTETDLSPGERCYLIREPSYIGTVAHVEVNRLSVMVRWDGETTLDFQWANKVARIDPEPRESVRTLDFQWANKVARIDPEPRESVRTTAKPDAPGRA